MKEIYYFHVANLEKMLKNSLKRGAKLAYQQVRIDLKLCFYVYIRLETT